MTTQRQSSSNAMFPSIQHELDIVEKKWRACLRDANDHAVRKLNDFFRISKGKRLRSALTILACGTVLGKLPQKIEDKLTNVALAIELLHRASLIHDDTIDSASMRHSKPTINSTFGAHVAIASGDYLYCWALKLLSILNDVSIFHRFSNRAYELCEGELVQIMERKNLTMTPARYFSIVKRKTAALFALSGETGALVAARKSAEKTEAMREFGLNFGMAYQVIDDLRDLVCSQEELGKEPGADFQMAELTLPMILLLKDPNAGPEVKRLLHAEGKDDSFERLREIAAGSDALKVTRAKAHGFLRKARASLASFDESPYKSQLCDLVEWLAAKGL